MSADYLLGHGSAESQRLNDQHDVWKKCVHIVSAVIKRDSPNIMHCRNLGFTIHPRILSSLPDAPNVADIGTGTGIWLLDIEKSHPSASMHGFDVSSEQLLYPESGRDNLKFSIADVRQPLSSELHGTFDLVHVRLLVFALKQEDWPTCVRNLKQLLKPGGWLQWEEIDPSPYTAVLKSSPTTNTSVLSQTLETFLIGVGKSRPEAMVGYKHLEAAFHSEGMEDVNEDAVSSELVLECRKMATTVMIRMMLETMRLAAKARGVEKRPEEEVDLAKQLEQEVEGGAYLQFYIRCVTGRVSGT